MNILNRLYKFEDMSNEDVLLNNGFQNVNQLIDYSNSLKEEIKILNNRVKWQDDKIARLSSENVCLETKIKLYEDGYKLDKEN